MGCFIFLKPCSQNFVLYSQFFFFFFFFYVVLFPVFLFYFEIVPSCVASCFSDLPSVSFSLLQVFCRFFPHLCFSRLTPHFPHPFISVCVCIYSLCSPLFLCHFISCSTPVMPPCVSTCVISSVISSVSLWHVSVLLVPCFMFLLCHLI